MHVKLLFAMIALAIIPIIFLQSFYINYMMNHIRANRVDLVRNYGAQIAEEMLQTDYLEGGNSDVIDGEIRQFSGLYCAIHLYFSTVFIGLMVKISVDRSSRSR